MRRFLILVPLVALTACGDDSSNPDGGGPDGSTTDGGGSDGTTTTDGGDGGVINVGQSVLMRNNHMNRDGLYVQSAFTTAAIATLKRDATFDGTIAGDAYAQPLYFEKGPGGKAIVIATTEDNQVTALDATTGAVVWGVTLILITPRFESAGVAGVTLILITPRFESAGVARVV